MESPARNLKLGSSDCHTKRVSRIMAKHTHSEVLFEKWAELQAALDTYFAELAFVRGMDMNDSGKKTKILCQLLTKWQREHPKSAVLGNLLDILTEIGLKDMAKELETPFKMTIQNANINNQTSCTSTRSAITSSTGLIVGDTECPFEKVTTVMMDNTAGAENLFHNWSDLASLLDIPRVDIAIMAGQRITTSSMLKERLCTLLTNWRNKYAECATLGNLIDILIQMNLNDMGNELEKHFSSSIKVLIIDLLPEQIHPEVSPTSESQDINEDNENDKMLDKPYQNISIIILKSKKLKLMLGLALLIIVGIALLVFCLYNRKEN